MARDEKLANKTFMNSSGNTVISIGNMKVTEFSTCVDGAETQVQVNHNPIAGFNKYFITKVEIGDNSKNTSSEPKGYVKVKSTHINVKHKPKVKTTQSSVAKIIPNYSINKLSLINNNAYLGRRNFSTCNSNQKLKDLIMKSEALDKKLSVMIAKELKSQSSLPYSQRTWITDDKLIKDKNAKITNNMLFKQLIPTIVDIRRYLAGICISKKVFPSFKHTVNRQDTQQSIKLILEESNNITPNTQSKDIKELILNIRELSAQLSTNNFEITSECEYPLNDFYKISREPEPIVREYVENKDTFLEVFKEAGIESMFESLVFKIHAIDLTAKTNGNSTPGIDNIAFKKTMPAITRKPESQDPKILNEAKKNAITDVKN